MRYLYFLFFFLLNVPMHSQCFDCGKSIGGWTSDAAVDIEKTNDGIVYLVSSGGFVASRIIKYDFNCNEIWSINFGYEDVAVKSVTSDEQGNIYLVIDNLTSTNAGLGPWDINGFSMSPGINFYKLNSAGTILWNRHIGPHTGNIMQNIHYYQNHLYVTGTFYDTLTFSNGLSFNFPYTDNPRAFIAKYDTDGNFINAINFGDGEDKFKYSEFDNQGNIYLTRYKDSYSKVDKFNAVLQLSWTKVLSSSNTSSEGIYIPGGIHFNNENNKLYVWGIMNLTTTIIGNTFFINSLNSVFQSALIELNSSTGNLENINRFDNNNDYYSLYFLLNLSPLRIAHFSQKDGFLYVHTSFTNTMSFPNATITSTSYHNNEYFSQDLVLFKINLSNFSSEFLFRSSGNPSLMTAAHDLSGPILFNGNDLYLTATYRSNPIQINGTTINNNSGNNDSDAMFYKFSIDQPANPGTIIVQNTCFNQIAQFSINGTYDSVVWNFNDPNALNNSSTSNTPNHVFSATGVYNVSATVTCDNSTQVLEKNVHITNVPFLNSIEPLMACETISGSGISNAFDTSNLNNLLIGNQPNIVLEFRNSSGQLFTNLFPNPYTNSNSYGDTIYVKAYHVNNPNCSIETELQFIVSPKPEMPIIETPQYFCTFQNQTLQDVLGNSNNIIWYDSEFEGNLLMQTTPLIHGQTYYAAQSNAICESTRVPVLIHLQNTTIPTGSSNQNICLNQQATLNDLIVNGDNLKWYNSISSTQVLPTSTQLVDGLTYYVSQTINQCESTNRFAVTVSLINSLNANDYAFAVCDALNDGTENINLTDYNSFLISNPVDYNFEYYQSLDGALNQIATNLIDPTNYNTTIGDQIIYVRIVSSNGCSQIVSLKITLFGNPIIPIEDDVSICEGTKLVLNAGDGFNSYSWSTGQNTQSITISEAGNYTITVNKINGNIICSTTKTIHVVFSKKPLIINIKTKQWTDHENAIEILTNSNKDDHYDFSIDGINYQESNQFFGLRSGKYTVYVRDTKGCGIATQEISLLMYPKFFTPNGDGQNETWAILFSDSQKNLETYIFDRNGKLLKKLHSSDAWDGNYNGNPVPSSDYWFVVTNGNAELYKGHFSLIR
ncbi:hypothetical protein EG240_12370 [Paenimyroides tangerinum]|uniref:PKD domain-containing protein n=2 Tax=Paenimyroides tangerinum TaxID=2488728 RepID=A0A3P3W2A7_9FLAO|nr:hypothetical protein EG240_12370 [Paenimyroides tangerinum]